jgi:hypothetical protein
LLGIGEHLFVRFGEGVGSGESERQAEAGGQQGARK